MLRRLSFLILPAALALASTGAFGRDDHLKMSIDDALATPAAKEKVRPQIKLFFSGQKAPAVTKELDIYTTNLKTNSFGKSDKEACDWVFLSCIIALQKRADEAGGDAVVNIHSVYRDVHMESPTQYMCGAGSIMAGVALTGTIVKLAK